MTRGMIHTLTVRNPGTPTADSKGRPTTSYTDTVVEHCRIMPRIPKTEHPRSSTSIGGGAGPVTTDEEAIAYIASGTNITTRSLVVASGTRADGTWFVTSLIDERVHLRVELKRWNPS